jgi:serine/threonine protein kinase
MVFKALNTRTNEIKAIKAVPNIIKDNSTLSPDISIGIELGKTCPYLVRYYNVFEEGYFQIIVMDYFSNGDLKKYLKKVKELNEEVLLLLLFSLYLYEYVGYYSFNTTNNNSSKYSSSKKHNPSRYKNGEYTCR